MATAWEVDPLRVGLYEIRVDGTIPESALREFEGLTASVEPVATVLRGPVADQAALQGLMARLRSLKLDVLEVRRLPDDRPEHDRAAGEDTRRGLATPG